MTTRAGRSRPARNPGSESDANDTAICITERIPDRYRGAQLPEKPAREPAQQDVLKDQMMPSALKGKQLLKISLVAAGSLVAMSMDLATYSDRQVAAGPPGSQPALVADLSGSTPPDGYSAPQTQIAIEATNGQDLVANLVSSKQ